ncbi:cholinesterase 1-like [Patiria miniata]|uniref:Carboxylic ester hydrolase n=1 Tax=Patiria miniata TaxID=46514 RepID=A0A914BU37_PATMI|nr:cholinesterase 1-like [Patiria miniata]XP_038079406.1 cholinesterase 1-like [Patiria miniata]
MAIRQAHWRCVFYLTLPLVLASNLIGDDPPVATTSQGRIIGTRLEFSPTDPKLRRSVDAYLGIPYAEAPVGPLRFKPPVAKSWSGELQATKLGNRCPQPPFNFGFTTVRGTFNENCLFLDVFVPQHAPAKAAVLVFLHGGAFFLGAGTIERTPPTPIAAVGDVIVVTLNYRLGALGFLSTDDDVIPGNMGLLDQRLALEWVRDNIEAFGGDPERVAIFGESAGAASVSFHMLSPGSAGLFHAAIMESGAPTVPWATVRADEARRRAFALGKLVGCKRETSGELLACLQKVKDFNTFVENQHKKLHQELNESYILTSFVPVVDGKFLPRDPIDLYEEGAINDAAVIIGGNADERMLQVMASIYRDHTDRAPFVDSASYDALTRGTVSQISAEPIVAEAIKLMYRNASCADAPDCDYLQALSQVLGDITYLCPIDRATRAFAKAGLTVYQYHMTHAPTTSMTGTKWTGATHLDDLLFVFGLPLISSDEYSFTADEARMSLQVIKYWTNLAKTGNPNLTEGEEADWPVFSPQELAYKDLSPAMLNGRAIKAKECLMLNEFIPKLAQIAVDAKRCRESS